VRYFDLAEFDCQETGENDMSKEFLSAIDDLREKCGFSFVITSGYRSRKHSIEKAKNTPGTHAQGIACDIKVNGGVERFRIVEEALKMGFNGIGIAKNFVHVDLRKTTPVLWCY
tara:strand:+ start:1733 stop:2074 length:342 start_codon:yes stop_codon:yes gene_type:complete